MLHVSGLAVGLIEPTNVAMVVLWLPAHLNFSHRPVIELERRVRMANEYHFLQLGLSNNFSPLTKVDSYLSEAGVWSMEAVMNGRLVKEE